MDNVATTLDDIAGVNEKLLTQYLAPGTAPVHIVVTLSPGSRVPLNLPALLNRVNYMHHDALGRAVLVRQHGRLPVMEYVINILASVTGLHFRMVDTWPEAQRLLQAADPTLAGVTFPPAPAP
jgi:hypothetical protein